MFKKNSVALLLSCVTANASAGLEFVEFKSTNNESQLVSSFSNVYINNAGGVVLYIASGLDRKLHVKLKRGGTVVEDITTSVINTNDRINKGGKEFYGKTVSLSKLTVDGEHTIEIDTLSLNGSLVATDSYELTRDVVPPVISDADITWIRNAYSYGNIDHFSYTDSSLELRLNSLSEDRSGLSHVEYFISTPGRLAADKNDRSVLAARLNKDGEFLGNATIATSQAANPNVAPKQDLYTIGFDVFDKAGNKGSFQRNSHIDNNCPPSPTIQVLNANTNQWEPYVANMTIHANPVKMRWGRDTSTFENGTKAPYGWVSGNNVSYTNGSTAYYERTMPIPQDYSYFYFYTRSGEICHRQTLSNFKFTFANGVDSAPVGNGVWYKTNLPEHGNNWIKSSSPKYNKPYTITAVRHHAEARAYRQKAWGSSIPTCYIEPGQTYCDSTTNISYSSGRGYSPKAVYLDRESGGLNIHYGYIYTYWDMTPPQVKSVESSTETKSIISKSYDPDTVSDWRDHMWVISKVEAEISSKTDQSTYRLSPSKTTQLDIQNREDIFDVSKVDDGDYEVTVVATDSYGNVGSSQQLVRFKVDNTPPAIDIEYGDLPLPDTIVDIRNIRFILTDASDAVVSSGRLFGSSSNENVYLGIIDHGDGVYSFEQPKIFPTLLDGESYSLEVNAEDEYKNSSSKTITFKYMPENLIEMDVQSYLGVAVKLYDEDDSPLAKIFSNALLQIDEGMLATGIQNAYITNRSDSEISVVLVLAGGEVTVAPGETKPIQVDLGDSGDALNIEVYPATEVEGKASLMFDIPQLTSKYNQ